MKNQTHVKALRRCIFCISNVDRSQCIFFLLHSAMSEASHQVFCWGDAWDCPAACPDTPHNTVHRARGNKHSTFPFSRLSLATLSSAGSTSAVFGKLPNPFKLRFATAVCDDREHCMGFAIRCKQQGARRNGAVRDGRVITEVVKPHQTTAHVLLLSLPADTEVDALLLSLCLYRSHFHQCAHASSISAFIFMNQDVSSSDSSYPALYFGQEMNQD